MDPIWFRKILYSLFSTNNFFLKLYFWGFSPYYLDRIVAVDRKQVGEKDEEGSKKDLVSDSNPGHQIYGTAS